MAKLESHDRCIACGYDISNLPLAATCPECGLTAAESFSKSHLIRPRTRYRDNLLCGATLYAIGIGLCYVGSFAANVVLRSQKWTFEQEQLVWMSFLTIGQLLWYCGGIVFTAPERGTLERNQDKLIRRIARAACVVCAVCSILRWIGWARITLTPSQSTALAVVDHSDLFVSLGRISIVAFVASVALLATMMLYVQEIAPRLPSNGIQKIARLLFLAGPVILILQFFQVFMPHIAYASFGANVLELVLFAWISVLLLRLR